MQQSHGEEVILFEFFLIQSGEVDIANARGYATLRSLDLLFKKHHGLTPGTYARRFGVRKK